MIASSFFTSCFPRINLPRTRRNSSSIISAFSLSLGAGLSHSHQHFQLFFSTTDNYSFGDGDGGGGRRRRRRRRRTRKMLETTMATKGSAIVTALLATTVVLFSSSPALQSPETFSNVPQTLSGDDPRRARIQRPKSRNAESCTIKCVGTCIRGGAGSPGEGPLNVRRPLVVFKQGFRSRQYCLVECSDICNLIKDGEDGP